MLWLYHSVLSTLTTWFLTSLGETEIIVYLFGLEDKSPQGNFIKEFKVKDVEKYGYLILKELVKLWLKSNTKQLY